MSRKLTYYCAVVLMLAFSACAAPAVLPTETLPPAPTMTETEILQPTLSSPTETQTLTPELTITATWTPRPTPVFPKECGTVTLGEPGTQSQDKTHPVLVQGTAILCNETFRPDPDGFGPFISLPLVESRLDLDTGRIGTEVADVWFDIFGGSDIFYDLISAETAIAVKWGISVSDTPEPMFDECKNLSPLFANDNGPKYVCVITNAGHVSRIKVEQYEPLQVWFGGSLKISFITWDVVVPVVSPTPWWLPTPTP